MFLTGFVRSTSIVNVFEDRLVMSLIASLLKQLFNVCATIVWLRSEWETCTNSLKWIEQMSRVSSSGHHGMKFLKRWVERLMTSFATEWESDSSTISTSSFSSFAALLSPTSFFFLWVYSRINTHTQTHKHCHRFKCTKWCGNDSQKLGCRYSRNDDSSLTRSWSSSRERCHNKPALRHSVPVSAHSCACTHKRTTTRVMLWQTIITTGRLISTR